ncbi:hypothetical protein HDK90DRAFT_470959 [Phyllosticta capitalensis]|uniref:Uncharacterized protein n=1 Tax=Phyllosticta capitalensis TaxID=121624 RepID=A0ABR1Y987_9PEZI
MEPPAEFAAQYHADAVLMHLAREAFDLLLLYLDHHVQTLNAIQLHCVGSSSYLLSGAQSIVDTGSSCVDFSALNIKKGKEAPYSNAQCVKLTDRSIAFKFDIWRDAERAVKHPKLASPLPNGSGRSLRPSSTLSIPTPRNRQDGSPQDKVLQERQESSQEEAVCSPELAVCSPGVVNGSRFCTGTGTWVLERLVFHHAGPVDLRKRLRDLAIVLGGPLDRHGERRVFLEPKCPSRNLIRDSSLMLGPKAERLEALTLPPRRSVTALPSSRKMRRLARVPLDVFLDPNRESSSPDFDVDRMCTAAVQSGRRCHCEGTWETTCETIAAPTRRVASALATPASRPRQPAPARFVESNSPPAGSENLPRLPTRFAYILRRSFETSVTDF